jgi:hypothetical protein
MDMEMLRETALDFTDDRLLDIYRNQRGDYNPEAFKIFTDELARRGIDPDADVAAKVRAEAANDLADAAAQNATREDFAPLPLPFSKTDALIANAILRDSKVPYLIDKYVDPVAAADASVGALAGEKSATLSAILFGEHTVVNIAGDMELFAVLVYKSALSTAQKLIDEHFDVCPKGNRYISRHSDITDRIKSFSLYDLQISDAAAQELIDVDLSQQEKAAVVKLAKTLLKEAETIEEEQGRVVFFYDSLEAIADKLNGGASSLSRTEFLAIIEMCQIYCDDERYDPALNHIAASILDFFLG